MVTMTIKSAKVIKNIDDFREIITKKVNNMNKAEIRLKNIDDMLNNLGLWQGDSEDRLNIEKRGILLGLREGRKEVFDRIDEILEGIEIPYPKIKEIINLKKEMGIK